MQTKSPQDYIPNADKTGELVTFHEVCVILPKGYDRTTNLFVPGNIQSQPNLSIARDWLSPEETLERYVDRQCRLLKQRLGGFTLINRDNLRARLRCRASSSIPPTNKTQKRFGNGKPAC